MLLPNSNFSVQIVVDHVFFLNKKNEIKLLAYIDDKSYITRLVVFNNLGMILKDYTKNNDKMFFEILNINDREVIIKILNRYSKIEKVRFL